MNANHDTPTAISSNPNTSSRNLPDFRVALDLPDTAIDRRILLEEMACAITDAQAALFAGRIQDFEACVLHQQNLCAAWKRGQKGLTNAIATKAKNNEFVYAARRQQNPLFRAVARRMHRHLDTLRNLVNGLSSGYQPTKVKLSGRES